LYTLETNYSILVQGKDKTQVYNYNIIFLNNFVLDYIKNAYNQRVFSSVAYTFASLQRQTLLPRLVNGPHFETRTRNHKLEPGPSPTFLKPDLGPKAKFTE